ncbi:MAG: hypothetical protein JST87_05275 [Bacteroidetes bacterium]|nr:hypothetical protein [Bacteroidota bacterium]
MISNGYDTQAVMNALFGRIKWRSLNPGGTYPLNLSVGATRSDFFIKTGTTTGLSVGGTTYSDSSLIGWTYDVEQIGYGTLKQRDPLNPSSDDDILIDTVNGGWSLVNGTTFSLGQKFVEHFLPQQQVTPNNFSSRYYEQFHPLCTLDNLSAVIEQDLSTGSAFTSFLTDLEQGMIMTLLNGIFSEPQMIEDTVIFDRQLRNDIPYTNSGKFVGYRLFIAPGEFAAKIAKASFIFNGAATFNLYLYQDMQKVPLYTQTVTTVANQEVMVDLTDWIIHYQQPGYSQGGVYYIGYYQNDLGSVQALDQFVNRWNESLAFGYTAMEAVQLANQYDFVRIQVPYTYKTYGMNLQIETYRDFTNRIVKNANLFDEALGIAMATVVLGYMAYTTRTNYEQRQLKDMANILYGEINNSGVASEINPYIAGLKQQLKREMKKINDNFFKNPGVIASRPPVWGTESLQGVFP